jgi:hypothetical protein
MTCVTEVLSWSFPVSWVPFVIGFEPQVKKKKEKRKKSANLFTKKVINPKIISICLREVLHLGYKLSFFNNLTIVLHDCLFGIFVNICNFFESCLERRINT